MGTSLVLASGCTSSSNNSNQIKTTTTTVSVEKKKIIPLFGKRKPLPTSLPKLPRRDRSTRANKAKHIPQDPAAYNSILNQCFKHYNSEWEHTRTILESLKDKSDCWDDEQKLELEGLQANLVEYESQYSALPTILSQDKDPSHLVQDKADTLESLAVAYNLIQNHLSYCRLYRILEESPPPLAPNSPVTEDDSALAHILGEPFALKSGFEGSSDEVVLNGKLLKLRQGIYHKIKEIRNKQTFIETQRQADPCYDISEVYHPEDDSTSPPLPDLSPSLLDKVISQGETAIDIMDGFRTSQKDFFEVYKKKLDEKLTSPGDSFFFQGGTVDHAVVYQVVREEGPYYRFRVFNSGSGLNYHATSFDGATQAYFPYFEKSHLSYDAITGITFLKTIRDLMIQRLEGNGSSIDSKIDTVYSTIFQDLGGYQTTASGNPGDYLQPQIAGTCAYYSLPYYHETLLGDKAISSHLEFLIRMKYFDSYMASNSQRLKTYRPQLRLAKKSYTFLMEEIAETFQRPQGYLDPGMARMAHQRMVEYRNFLNESALEQFNQIASNPDRYDAETPLPEADLPYNYLYQGALLTSQASQYLSYPNLFQVESWVPKANTLDQDLSQFLKPIQNVQLESSYAKAETVSQSLTVIREIAKKLPLDESFYNSLDKNRLELLLEKLDQLSKAQILFTIKLFQSDWSQSRGVPPIQALAQIKILTVADLILQKYKQFNPILSDIPGLYQKIIDPVILGESSLITIKDKSWEEPYFAMKEYWKNRKSSDSFFQFERYPLFAEYENQRIIAYSQINKEQDQWSSPYGEYLKWQWNDINWVLNKINNGTIPSNHGTSRIKQALQELVEMDSKSHLPKQFFQLRLISYLTHFYFFGTFDRTFLNSIGISPISSSEVDSPDSYFFDFQLDDWAERQAQNEKNPYSRSWYLEQPYYHKLRQFNSTWLREMPKETPQGIFPSGIGSPGHYLSLSEGTLKLKSPLSKEDPKIAEKETKFEKFISHIHMTNHMNAGQTYIPIQYLQNRDSSQIISTRQDPKSPLTLEMYRRVLNFKSILTTLAFFQEHPNYLRDRQWQTVFKTYVFQPGQIQEEYRKTPTLQNIFIRFCNKNYQDNIQDGDYVTALFFVRMKQHFLEFYEEFQSKFAPAYPLTQAKNTEHSDSKGKSKRKSKEKSEEKPTADSKIDPRGDYLSLLGLLSKEIGRDSGIKNVIYRDIIRTYLHETFTEVPGKKKISPEDVALYLIAGIYRQRFPLTEPEDFEPDEENAIEGIHALKLERVLTYLGQATPSERNQVFNQVIHTYFHSEKPRDWKEQRPDRSEWWPANIPSPNWQGTAAELHALQIDLANLIVKVDGKVPTSLPNHILEDPLFIQYVKYDATEEPLDLGDRTYEILDKDGRRVRVSARGTLIIQKKWADQWYQLSANDRSQENWAFMPGYIQWVSVYQNDNSLTIPNVNSAPPYLGWQKPQGKKEVLNFHPKTGKLDFVTRTGQEAVEWKPGGAQSSYRTTVSKLDRSGGLSELTLQSILDPANPEEVNPKSPVAFLARFEHPRFIWVWMNQKTRQIDHIELSRFGLNFYRNPKGELISHELEGFKLSEIQSFEGWEQHPHYLVLEKAGQKKLLFPRFKFKPLDVGTQINYDLDFDLRNTDLKSQRFFTFTVDSFHQSLMTEGLASEFYLSYLYLWDHENEKEAYERALDHLYGSGSDLGPYSKDELEILSWLLGMNNKDNDPRAIALRVGAACLMVKNSLSHHYDLTHFSQRTATDLYLYYLRTKEKISTRWLPEDLELIFLSTLRKEEKLANLTPNPLYEGRWAELRGEDLGPNQLKNGESLKVPRNTPDFHRTSLPYSYSNAKEATNVFQGGLLKTHFFEAYDVSKQFDNPHLIDSKLRNLLSKLLTLDIKTVNLYSVNKLKEDYLFYLRTIIRGNSSGNRELASFLYSVAVNTQDRSQLPDPGYLKRFINKEIRLDSSNKEASEEFNRQFAGVILNTQDFNPTFQPQQHADAHIRRASQSFFWDQKDNPTYSPDFTHSYDLTGHFKKYDLRQQAIIPEKTLKQWIQEHPLTEAQQAELDTLSSQLSQVFSHTLKNPEGFIQNHLKHFVSAIQERKESQKRKGKNYQLVNLKELKSYKDELEQQKPSVFQETKNLENKIMKLARKLPANVWEKVNREMLKEGAIDQDPRLQRLIVLYAKNSPQEIFNSNRSLSQNEITQLLHDLTSYLVMSTYYFKLVEVIQGTNNLIQKVESYKGDQNPSDIFQIELQTYYTQATQLRGYEIEKYPELLVFEYFMRILIRKDQIDSLTHLNITERQKAKPDSQGVLLEMIMGSGKTFVLLPLLSHFNAKPNQLSIILLPESLLPSMVKQISMQLNKAFGQGVDRLTVQRKDHYDYEKLDFLYHRLLDDLHSQRVVVTSNSSIQSLFLIFIEKLYEYDTKNSSQQTQELGKLQDIFFLLRNYGYATIDEVDLVMDVMQSHRFSLGNAGKIERDISDAVAGLYTLLVQDHEIHNQIQLPFIPNQTSHAKPLNQEVYQQDLKPLIIQRLLKDESAKHFFSEKDLITQFQYLNKKELKDYFYSSNPDQMDQFIGSIKEVRIKNVLSVLYTEINQVLPLTLAKLHRVHFGIYPRSNCVPNTYCPEFISIPYHSGTAMVNSRFGTDLESLNYTIQTHLEERNTFRMLLQEYETLKNQYKGNVSESLKERIREFFGAQVLFSSFLKYSEDDIKLASLVLDQKPELIIKLAKFHAVPQITIFPNQLQTNSHIYPMIFRTIQGVSGTLWNRSSFPSFYEDVFPSDTLARTLLLLWKNQGARDVSIIRSTSETSLPHLLQKIIPSSHTSPVSIIDQGGILRNHGHEQVAREMAKNERISNSGLSNLIYYDEQHETKIYESHDGSSRPYLAYQHDRNRTGAFWDMEHTTGSDLKVHPEMRGVLTVNQHSTIRDILQSAWRLRELEAKQSVTFAVPYEDLLVMVKTLNEYYHGNFEVDPDNPHFTLDHLFLYLATNEAIISGNLNFRSLKAEERSIVIDSIFDLLLDKSVKDHIQNSFAMVKRFFDDPRGHQPYERFGVPLAVTNPLTYMKNEISRLFKASEQYFENKEEIQGKFDYILSKNAHKLRKEVIAPVQQAHSHRTAIDVDTETEIEMELQMEQEQEQEQELKVQVHNVDSNFAKARLKWDQGKLMRGEYFTHFTTKGDIQAPVVPATLKSPIVPIQDIFELSGNRRLAAELSPKLYASLNLFPVFKDSQRPNDPKFTPFGLYQGPINEILTVFDSKDHILMAVLLDRDEAFEIGDWLIQDLERKTSQLNPAYRVAIYEFGNGFIRVSKNVLDNVGLDHLEDCYLHATKKTGLYRLLVQAKFLGGRLNYDEKEKKILKRWLSRAKAPIDLARFFQEKILEYKDTTREEFEESDIKELFHELSSPHLEIPDVYLIFKEKKDPSHADHAHEDEP